MLRVADAVHNTRSPLVAPGSNTRQFPLVLVGYDGDMTAYQLYKLVRRKMILVKAALQAVRMNCWRKIERRYGYSSWYALRTTSGEVSEAPKDWESSHSGVTALAATDPFLRRLLSPRQLHPHSGMSSCCCKFAHHTGQEQFVHPRDKSGACPLTLQPARPQTSAQRRQLSRASLCAPLRSRQDCHFYGSLTEQTWHRRPR